MRDEKELIPDDHKYKVTDDGSLMIQNTQEDDGGYYECLAKNLQGEVKSRPARMVVISPEFTTAAYGKSTIFISSGTLKNLFVITSYAFW